LLNANDKKLSRALQKESAMVEHEISKYYLNVACKNIYLVIRKRCFLEPNGYRKLPAVVMG